MKRKLFSAILFGALLTASTSGLTSCKDYDDDISNLQSQIDKLATKEELATKASELSTAISKAQSAADAAMKVAEDAAAAAKAAATKDDVEAAKKAAIEAGQAAADKAQKAADAAQAAADKNAEDLKKAADGAQKAVEEIQTAMEGLATTEAVNAAVKEVADKYDAQAKELKALSDRLAKVEAKLGLGEGGEDIDLTEIQAELEDIEDAFEALVGVVSDMVTSVELVYCSGHGPENDLNFTIVTEKKNETFGKDVATEILTTANGQTRFESADVLVRVNPVDAEISASDVSLINSKGEELTGLVEATKVERYASDEYMTRAAGTNTGLWKVTYAPVTGANADELKAKFSSGGNSIVYAVAVKSAISDSISANRRVVSAYDITMKTTPAVAYNGDPTTGVANQNLFKANDKSIDELQNRYSTVNGTTIGSSIVASWPKEYVWQTTGGSAAANGPAVTPVYPGATSGTVNTVLGDNRDATNGATHKLLVVKPGDDIKIKFAKNIKGFYVALDYKFALDKSTASDPSEINAWNSYQYEGIANLGPDGKVIGGQKATMFKGKEGVVRVSSLRGEVTNDIIGLRVFAMNLDGTLLDPDGVAFYVNVGESGSDIDLGAQNVKVLDAYWDGNNKTQDMAITKGSLSGAKRIDWVAKKVGDNNSTGTEGIDYRLEYHINGTNTWQTWTVANVADYDAVRIYITVPTTFKDEATYKFTGSVVKETTSNNEYVWKTLTATITKKMPTSSDAPTYVWNVGQTEEQILKSSVGTNDLTYTNGQKDGMINFNDVFIQTGTHWQTGSNLKIADDYKFIFGLANTKLNQAGNAYTETAWVVGSYPASADTYKTTIPYKLVDCRTPHAVTTLYNFGPISSEDLDANTPGVQRDWCVPTTSQYSIKYMTWSYKAAGYMDYAWRTNKIKNGNTTLTANFDDVKIAQTITIDLGRIVAKPGSKIPTELRKADLYAYQKTAGWLNIAGVKLVGDNNIVNPYYEYQSTTSGVMTLTQKAGVATIPEHTETLQITVKDCFGHSETISLPLNFKYDEPAYSLTSADNDLPTITVTGSTATWTIVE